MKIDMNRELMDLEDKPIFEADAQGKPTTKVMTLRSVCRTVLLAPLRGDDALTGAQKADFFALALIVGQDEPDLKAEQIATLKERIGKGYPPLVVGRSYELLDPPAPVASVTRLLTWVLIAAVVLAACVSPPPEIPPRYVSPLEFKGWTCEEVLQELWRVGQAVSMTQDRHERARLAGRYRTLVEVDALRQCYRRARP